MNTVFGISIAVMIFIVSLLGINVFYPRPAIDDYNCGGIMPRKIVDCPLNITVGDCNELRQSVDYQTYNDSMTTYQACYDRFSADEKVYNRDFFLVTSIIGFAAIVVSMNLFTMINIAAGTAFSGLALIVFGFLVGWNSTDDWIKFLISLAIMALVTYFAILVNKRYEAMEKYSKKKK